mmetsp:Transcript_25478/g.33277  ORF Transcript_25478/g.33277 Transcript_25478/m.33277 type:complete len:226 (-) Transcript_25478:108-785(-)
METVTIFDWDDTLLPSSWLVRQQMYPPGGEVQKGMERFTIQNLHEIEKSVFECLETALQYGNVVIITKAEEGWVEYSAKFYMPSVSKLLERVWVLSVRTFSNLQNITVTSFQKHHVFSHCLGAIFSASHPLCFKRVVAIGDALEDRAALFAASRHLLNCTFVSVKFFDSPSIEGLRHELVFLQEGICDLMKATTHQDLIFTNSDGIMRNKILSHSTNQQLAQSAL